MVEFDNNDAGRCAKDIIAFLLKHEMWIDTCVYVNGKRYTDYDGKNYHYDNNWDCVFVEENKNPKDYFNYVGDFLSMSFEGAFYDVVNYYAPMSYCDRLLEEFRTILNKYDKYFELGNAWNLTLFQK